MIELTKTGHVDEKCALARDVRMLLNAAYPDGAPNELDGYYARHGVPTTTILLSEGRRALGHLAIYERQIRIGDASERVGLDRRGRRCRRLQGLRARATSGCACP